MFDNDLNIIFSRSVKNIIKSNEAYFSKTTSLEFALSDLVTDLRIIFNNCFNVDSKIIVQNKKNYASIIEKQISRHQNVIARAINAERVVIGIRKGANAAALPLIWDNKLIDSRVKQIKSTKYKFNEKFAETLEDIMETSDGYKFKNPNGKILVIVIGIDIFSANITDQEMIAVLLHEIGHGLQQMLVNVNTEIYAETKRTIMNDMFQFLEIVDSSLLYGGSLRVFKLIWSIIRSFAGLKRYLDRKPTLRKVEKLAGKNEELAGEILTSIVINNDESNNRNSIADEYASQRNYNIKQAIKDKKGKFNIFSLIGTAFNKFLKLLTNFSSIFYHLLYPFVNLTSKYVFFNKKFLTRELRYEQFADYIATSYGYGAELSSALVKIKNIKKDDKYDERGLDLGLFNFLHFVPMVNLVLAYTNYIDSKSRDMIAGYPTTTERLEGMYKVLDYELKHNTLSPTVKDKIEKEMAGIKEQYEIYKNKKGVKNLVMRIFYKITRKTIEKSSNKSSMIDNVLEPLAELDKEITKENNYTDAEYETVQGFMLNNESNLESTEALKIFI